MQPAGEVGGVQRIAVLRAGEPVDLDDEVAADHPGHAAEHVVDQRRLEEGRVSRSVRHSVSPGVISAVCESAVPCPADTAHTRHSGT